MIFLMNFCKFQPYENFREMECKEERMCKCSENGEGSITNIVDNLNFLK